MGGGVKRALYFGCIGDLGHYLHGLTGPRSKTLDPQRDVPGFPWGVLIDTGLLKNGERRDVYDGRVWWTCGGKDTLWLAFFWWDNSVDSRPGSNSGFYVEVDLSSGPVVDREFIHSQLEPAFAYACSQWPEVVARQKFPLVLQKEKP